MAEMSEAELKAILDSEKADAMSAMQSGTLSVEREDSMLYYLGDMSKDMPHQEGMSRAVSTDVADTVLGMMPFLMDVFCSSDDVVKFNAVGPKDEDAADQESDYINHVFMNQNPGFTILYEFIFDGLLQKIGAVKVWWDTHEQEEKETYLGLMEDQFAVLASDVLQPDSGLEIIEHDEEQQPAAPDPTTGQPGPPVTVHNVKILRTKNYAQAKVEACAPEEIGWSRNTRTMKDCNYFFHSPPNHTEGSLIAQGYDKEQVKSLPSYTFTDSEQQARDTVQEEFWLNNDLNRSARPIQLTEHYIRMDYKGNDKPCLYKVTTAGQNEVLRIKGKPDIEEVDVIPFAVLTPILQPHRLCGRSVADLVMDVQRINTALTRGLLDNAYMVANPRHEVSAQGVSENTIDDLLTVRRNGIVRVKASGTVVPLTTNSIVGELLPVLTYMDGVREMRSGVTRQGQGVDADALQNQSATAVQQVFSVAQAKMKLIARIFAETGIRDLFWLLHATVRKHGQEAATVKLRNKWQTVDPRNWVARNDMTINVGLGSGGKSEQFAQTMAIGNVQKELVGAGKTNIVDDQKLYNTAAALAKIAGHKNPDTFFNDPMEKNPDGSPKYPAAAVPPDPKVQAIQAKAQTDQATAAHKAQLEQQQAQNDAMHQKLKAEADAQLAQFKAELDAKLKLLDAHIQMAQAHQQSTHVAADHNMGVAEKVIGLVAGAQAHDSQIKLSEHAMQDKPKADA